MQGYLVSSVIGICLILMVFCFITDSLSKRKKCLFFIMALTAMLMTSSDFLARSFDGQAGIYGIVAKISKFISYSSNLLTIGVFTLYLKELLKVAPGEEASNKNFLSIRWSLIAGFISLIVSQFTGVYYYYDSTNTYHRAEGNFIFYVFSIVPILILSMLIITNRQRLEKMVASLLLFTLAPLVASVVHFLIGGPPFTGVAVAAMTVLLYIFGILDANKVAKNAKEQELKNQKLMLSQTAEALAEAIDAKDSYTNGHSNRVAKYSAMIAEEFGKTKEECEEIYLIALLHDVGKIGVPGSIINKPSKLTDEEYEIIKTHPTRGKEILEKISISPNLAIGAHYHHERYDGKGYPEGLKGEEIPEIARIIAVADTYDAMTSRRSYRDCLPKEKVISELRNGMGTQFDSKFAAIMVNLIESGKVH